MYDLIMNRTLFNICRLKINYKRPFLLARLLFSTGMFGINKEIPAINVASVSNEQDRGVTVRSTGYIHDYIDIRTHALTQAKQVKFQANGKIKYSVSDMPIDQYSGSCIINLANFGRIYKQISYS